MEDRRQLAAGDLDLSFGVGGLATTDLYSTTVPLDDGVRGVAVQADGKIVAAGYARGVDFALVRYNENGALDGSFGNSGKVTTDFGADDEAYDVVIAPTGKIVVVGNAGNDFAIARYTASGVLDATFGTVGKVVTNLGAVDGAVGVALDASGRIVVVGFSEQRTSGYDLAVVRYLASGALDASFGDNGKVLTHLAANKALLDVAIDAQGRIVGAGYSIRPGGTDYDFTLVRYLATGALDGSLSGDGVQHTNFNDSSPGFDVARSVAIDGQGRIVLAGDASLADIDLAAARYLENGTLDASFSADGKATVDFGNGSDRSYYGSAIDAAGAIVIGGYVAGGPTGWDFGLVRIEPDGDLDASFGAAGKVKTDFGAQSHDFGLDMAIAPDGKIVVAGESFVSGGYDFAVARYESALAAGEISGVKWNDVDGDGLRDDGEPGFAGWTIFLDQNRNRVLDAGELSTTTLADGAYSFTNLTPGDYFVAEVQQEGWAPTHPRQTLADQVRVFVSGGTHIINHNQGRIVRTNFDGGDLTTIHNDVYAPIGVDDRTGLLYFRESSAPGTTVRTDQSAQNPEVVLTGWGPGMYEIDSVNNRFFFPIGRDLYKASLDNPQPATIMAGLNHISDIEYDPATDAVITANTNALTTGDNVWSFPASGAGGSQIMSPLDDILGLAVDRVNRRIYFTDSLFSGGGFQRIIYAADIDGSNKRVHIDTSVFGLSRPTDIEVVPELDALFWIDRQLDGLYRAKLDGTGATRIADLSFDPEQLDVYVPFAKTSVGSGQVVANVDFGNRPVQFDFGDGPGSTFAQSMPVTLATNGARHLAVGPTLGLVRDSEADGAPSSGADADDLAGAPDDEDGVTFPAALASSKLSNRTGVVTVDLQNPDPSANILNAWIDWNRNNDWRDAGEQIVANLDLGAASGLRQISFTIPHDTGANVVPGETHARFRLSTQSGLKVFGAAGDGEIEDHVVTVTNVTPDIRVQSLQASGAVGMSLTYEIIDGPVAAFGLAFVRSADASSGDDELLAMVHLSDAADLATGVHVKSFAIGGGAGQIPLPGAGALEIDDDYYLLAVADPADSLLEGDAHPTAEDNTVALFGVYHAPGGDVLVHGGEGVDAVTVGTVKVRVDFNGSLTTYAFGDVARVRIRTHGGNDSVDGTTIKKSFLIHGGAGADSLAAGPLADVLAGGPGDDSLNGKAGDDRYLFDVDAALGADSLSDSSGVDTLDFSPTTGVNVAVNLSLAAMQAVHANLSLMLGSATIFENLIGGAGHDALTGTTKNNLIIGGPGDDSLAGGNGNDTFGFDADSPLGSDALSDAKGIDTLDFSATTTESIVVNLGSGAAQVVNGRLTVTLAATTMFENVIGGALGDLLTGTTKNNALAGGPGDDTLAGLAGADVYLFDADNQLGVDEVIENENEGVDTLDFSATTAESVVVDLAASATQAVNGFLQLRLSSASGIENVSGGAGSDTLAGNGLANVIIGGQGNDLLSGASGRDLLLGGTGADTLSGGLGDDILIGGVLSYFNESIGVLNQAAFDKLMAEWTRLDADYSLRVAHLQSGGGRNGSFRLYSGTVASDAGAVDQLLGDDDLDWFLAGAEDDLPDVAGGETATMV